MVSYDEWTRAFAYRNRDHYYEPYWNEWLTVDASGATELGWGHINERRSIQDEVKQWWNNTLADHGKNVWDNTTLTIDEATEWFTLSDNSDLDRDGDGEIRYSEFCMKQLQVEVACLSDIELDIQHWDTDNTGGIDYDEFVVIMEDEETGIEGDEFR